MQKVRVKVRNEASQRDLLLVKTQGLNDAVRATVVYATVFVIFLLIVALLLLRMQVHSSI